MNVNYTKRFKKAYKKLSENDQDKVDQAIILLMMNHNDPNLRNHSVSPKYLECRSIDAWFDLRILLKTLDDYENVSLVTLWSHSQLYG